MEEIQIKESALSGFSVLVNFEEWRIGVINYKDELSLNNSPKKIERHLKTDEAFILSDGMATLFTGKDLRAYSMEKNKVYNIPMGVWHSILLSPDAVVFVVENKNTSEKNTEVIYLDEGSLK